MNRACGLALDSPLPRQLTLSMRIEHDNRQSSRPDTLGRGLVILLWALPAVAANVGVSLALVARLQSPPLTFAALAAVALLTSLFIALGMRIVLRLPTIRCLREASAAGWALLAPNLVFFFWDLPRQLVRPWAAGASVVMLAWVTWFIWVFAANSRAARPD
jgi:hypothetical protein